MKTLPVSLGNKVNIAQQQQQRQQLNNSHDINGNSKIGQQLPAW